MMGDPRGIRAAAAVLCEPSARHRTKTRAHGLWESLLGRRAWREAADCRVLLWCCATRRHARTARLKHQSIPSTAFAQLSGKRRSSSMNSSQNISGVMCSFSFQSTPRTLWPSAFRRRAKCDAMKPPAPVTQILSLGKPSVNLVSSMAGRTILLSAGGRAN